MATVVVTVNNQKIGARSVSPKSRSHVDLPYGSVRRPTVRVIRVGGGGAGPGWNPNEVPRFHP